MNNFNLADIKKGWRGNDTAGSYDDKRFGNLSGKISDALDKLAIKRALSEIDKSGNILDLPCGTGRIMSYLYNIGYRNITGADISEQMLNIAKNKMDGCREVAFRVTEAEHTPFPDKSFDAIVSVRFMGHLPRETRIQILREFSRLCDGPIVVEYPVKNRFARSLKRLIPFLTVRARLPKQWEWHELSHSEMEEELQAVGIKKRNIIRKLSFVSESVYVAMW